MVFAVDKAPSESCPLIGCLPQNPPGYQKMDQKTSVANCIVCSDVRANVPTYVMFRYWVDFRVLTRLSSVR